MKKIALSAGLREASRWNISESPRRSRGRAIRTPEGWELAQGTRPDEVDANDGRRKDRSQPLGELRKSLSRIESGHCRSFVEEAVSCLEHGLYRSAVVLSWSAAALLYEYVITQRLADFNSEAVRRTPKWKSAATTDDLARMKEAEFLDALEAISIIGSVKAAPALFRSSKRMRPPDLVDDRRIDRRCPRPDARPERVRTVLEGKPGQDGLHSPGKPFGQTGTDGHLSGLKSTLIVTAQSAATLESDRNPDRNCKFP